MKNNIINKLKQSNPIFLNKLSNMFQSKKSTKNQTKPTQKPKPKSKLKPKLMIEIPKITDPIINPNTIKKQEIKSINEIQPYNKVEKHTKDISNLDLINSNKLILELHKELTNQNVIIFNKLIDSFERITVIHYEKIWYQNLFIIGSVTILPFLYKLFI